MEFSSFINEISAFGHAVMRGAKPGTVSVPDIPLNDQEFCDLVETIIEKNEESCIIGLSNAMFRILSSSIGKYNDLNPVLYTKRLLRFAIKVYGTNTIRGINKAFNLLASFTKSEWSDLISFLFNNEDSPNDILRANLLASLEFIKECSFAENNKEHIIRVLSKLFKSSEDIPKLSLIQLLTVAKPNESELKLLIDDIWFICLKESNSSKNISTLATSLHELSQIEGYSHIYAKPICDRVEIFKTGANMEQKIEAILPIIKLYPFIDEKSAQLIFEHTRELIQTSFPDILPVIDAFAESDMELLPDSIGVVIHTYITLDIENQNLNTAFLLLTPFYEHIFDLEPEMEEKILTAIQKNLKEMNSSVFGSMYLLRHISPRLQKPSLDVFGSLIKILLNDDVIFASEAERTVMELLSTQLFSDDIFEKELIKNYSSFKERNIKLFSKVLLSLVDNSSDPGLSLAEPIYDLAMPLLSSSSAIEEKALSIQLMGTLASISPDFIEDHIVDGIKIAKELIMGSDQYGSLISYAVEFLASVSTSFANESREIILELLPELLRIVKREIQFDEAERCLVSTAVCDIVAAYDIRDIACEISEIAYTDFLSNQEKASAEGAEMLFVLSKSLLPDVASSLFTRLSESVPIYPYKDSINVIIRSMKAIMKKYRVEPEVAHAFIKTMFEGKIECVGQIDLIEDPDTAVFEFLKAFTKKFKSTSMPFLKQVVELISFIDPVVLPTASSPIDLAIKMKLFDDQTMSDITVKFLSLISEIDSESTSVAFLILVSIKRSYPNCINDTELLAKLNERWEMCDEEEDPDLASAISMLTLEIASSHVQESGETIVFPLLCEIIDSLPMESDYCDLEEVIETVINISSAQWIAAVRSQIAHFLCRIIFMKKQELEEHEISNELLAKAKSRLSSISKGNVQIIESLNKKFGDTKAHKTLLSTLFK